MRLRISRCVVEAIQREAAEAPHREVCGLLFGSAEEITGHRSCANVAYDPARAFEIDPAALIAAHRAMREGGPAIVGCYHSHPRGLPTPSARDAASAASDGWLWLIQAGGSAELYRAVAEGAIEGRFDPVAWEIG